MLLPLLMLAHTFAFGSGCALQQGDACWSDDDCGFGSCDPFTGRCVLLVPATAAPSPPPDTPSTGSCTYASFDECPPYQLEFACTGQAKPQGDLGVDETTCQPNGSGGGTTFYSVDGPTRQPNGSGDGTTLYCCVETWAELPPLPFASGDGGLAPPGHSGGEADAGARLEAGD